MNFVQTRSPAVAVAIVLALLVASIVGALGFQAAGYAPCELCLKERLPYYLGIVVASLALALTGRGMHMAVTLGLVALTALFLFSAVLGAYHSGVEWGLWPGPSTCTGSGGLARTNAEFLQQLQNVRVVRCDAVAIRILGLSLAGWNVVVSVIVVAIAAAGLLGARRA